PGVRDVVGDVAVQQLREVRLHVALVGPDVGTVDPAQRGPDEHGQRALLVVPPRGAADRHTGQVAELGHALAPPLAGPGYPAAGGWRCAVGMSPFWKPQVNDSGDTSCTGSAGSASSPSTAVYVQSRV